MIDIRVNGEVKKFEAEMTLAELLDKLCIDGKHLAIEHNGVFVEDTADRNAIKIRAWDKLEIVRFVGGG